MYEDQYDSDLNMTKVWTILDSISLWIRRFMIMSMVMNIIQ